MALNIHKWFQKWASRTAWIPKPPLLVGAAMAWLLTQVFVYVTWVPFRAQSFVDTWSVLNALTGTRDDVGLTAAQVPYLLLFLPILVDTFVVGAASGRQLARKLPNWSHATAAVVLGAVFAVLLFMMPLEVSSFIYFQF
jgi:hypothetical protein